MDLNLIISPFQTGMPPSFIVHLLKYKFSKSFQPTINFESNTDSIYSLATFTTFWSSEVLRHISSAVSFADQVTNVLEIGCWEGASTLFLANSFQTASLTCVDTWEGSSGESLNSKNNSIDSSYDRFVANTLPISDRLSIARGSSQIILP